MQPDKKPPAKSNIPKGKPPLLSKGVDQADTKSVISSVAPSAISARSRGSSQSRRNLPKSEILSREEEARLAKEKKDKMDEIKKKYSRRSRANSKASTGRGNSGTRAQGTTGNDQTTRCTRDEDINIEEFMKEDMQQINREEDKLQKEIKQLHLKNIHKQHQVVKKHKIDT